MLDAVRPFVEAIPEIAAENTNKCISPFDKPALSSEDLKDLLRSIGFRVHHCSLRKTDFLDISTDMLLSSILAVSTFLDAMPPNTKEEFKEYAREFCNRNDKQLYANKQCDNKEKSILDKYKILIAYAQKDVQ